MNFEMLREELKKRDLDSSGTKNELIKRLTEAHASEVILFYFHDITVTAVAILQMLPRKPLFWWVFLLVKIARTFMGDDKIFHNLHKVASIYM